MYQLSEDDSTEFNYLRLLSIDFLSKGRKGLREGSVDVGPFAAEPHSTP